MKTYRPWQPDRTYLLPVSTRDWLPEDHVANFILDVIDTLDLSEIDASNAEKDARGIKAYAPRMMTALLLYGYAVGTVSSRGLAKATWTDLGARVIAAEEHPHFTTVNQFRLDNHGALGNLFLQVLKLCAAAGLVQLGHIAVDGTRIKANASKHKAMSYERMLDRESRLKAEIEALLAKGAQLDREEDATYGPDKDGVDIDAELRRRTTRQAKLRAAKEGLEREAAAARKADLAEQAERAAEQAAVESDPRQAAILGRREVARQKASSELPPGGPDDVPGAVGGLPFNTVPHDTQGLPKPKAQRNFTDPDSRIMQDANGYTQAYNAQIAVEEKTQIIVGQLLTNQGPDAEHFQPVVEQVRTNLGNYPARSSADAGYWSEANGRYCQDIGVDAYISTRRRRHVESDGDEKPLSAHARTDAAKAMEQKVMSSEGAKIYAKRKTMVEPVFGHIKEIRRFRRFSMRRLDKVKSEFAFVCAVHNLLKLARYAGK